MKRDELVAYLNTYLNAEGIPDYCPTGLQVEGSDEIRTLAVGLSANLETIERAVAAGVDALLVHHGMFWKGDSFVVSGSKREKLRLLLDNEISLLAYHLPLDAHNEVGNNWKAARDLGWKELEPFGDYNGTFIGVKGTFAPTPVEAFVEKLESYYAHPAHRAMGGKGSVSSGALISGGAWRSVSEAAAAGVDLFITGNFDEPAWSIAHEEKIHFFALGHSATETVGVKALAAHVQEKFGIATQFLDVTNPF